LKRSDAFLKFASLLTEPKEEPKCIVEEVVEAEPQHEETKDAIKYIKSLNSPYLSQKKKSTAVQQKSLKETESSELLEKPK